MKERIHKIINTRFYVYTIEITVREILVSISLISAWLLLGFVIVNHIQQNEMDYNEKFLQAVKIEGTDLLQYGMDTNIGNAFVYGELKAVDTVTYSEIDGEYMYVQMITEQYTRHTRTVTHTTTVNGKTQTYTTTEVYWTWDRVGYDEKTCQEVSFADIIFPITKIDLPDTAYVDTVSAGYNLRHVYYGVGTQYTGTIFTDLRDGTISDNSKFYNGLPIDKAVQKSLYKYNSVVFWIIWIILIIIITIIFYCADNKWLD